MTPEVRDCICHNDHHCSRQSSVLSTGWQSVVINCHNTNNNACNI